jgi:hypothetical protein
LICLRRQAFTTITSHRRLSCSFRRRASPFCFFVFPDSSLLRNVIRLFPATGDTSSPGSSTSISTTLFLFLEKERTSNASAINREESHDYTILSVGAQLG